MRTLLITATKRLTDVTAPLAKVLAAGSNDPALAMIRTYPP
jgi:hypothetical protein